jgi:hypothetical protein
MCPRKGILFLLILFSNIAVVRNVNRTYFPYGKQPNHF